MPVTINPASKITAPQWVAMIQRSQHIPQDLKRSIKANNNVIVGPTSIKIGNTIPPDWLHDLAAAFASRDWEITTAAEIFVVIKDATGVRVRRRIFLDLQKSKFGPGIWLKTGPSQRKWMPDNQSFDKSYKVGEIAVQFGETFSSRARLQSGRRLIMIINRVTVHGVKPSALLSSWFPAGSQYFETAREFRVPESGLLSYFLHELAAHAGRMDQGKNADHGYKTVDSHIKDIEKLFPEDRTLVLVVGAVHEAARRLQDLDSRSRPGRTPGPLRGPSSGARPPGPLR
jgi:hypothetical protein